MLIIRFSSIGDIVLTSPLVRCLKKQKNVELHYLTKERYQELLNFNPYIDKIFLFQNNLKTVLNQLKNEKYDTIIDLQNNILSWWLKLNLNVFSYTLQKQNFKKFLFIYFNLNYLDGHVVDWYFDCVKRLNVVNDDIGLDWFFKKQNQFNFNVNQSFIAWSIGGSFIQKQLSKNQIINVCNMLSRPIVLLGGVDVENLGVTIIKESTNNKIYNFCGKLSLNESAQILKHSELVLSNDTGLMHIASAFQKPIISFWGCTKPNMGFSPYFADKKSIQIIANPSSSPCSRHGSWCKFEKNGCVKTIDYKLIFRAVSKLLNH